MKEMIDLKTESKFLLESIPILVWTKNPEGDPLYFNHKWTDYTGLPVNEGSWDWTDLIHPSDHDNAVSQWAASLQTGKIFEFECRLKRKDNVFRWHLSRAIPMKDNAGKIVIWVGTCTDIHDNKNREEELDKKNKELSKINMDLDNFVYTASHDLKSPISNLEGLTHALKDDSCFKAECEHKEMLDMIERSVIRLKKTINDLTEITKAQKEAEEDIEVISISDVLEEVRADIARTIEESAALLITDIKADTLTFSHKNLRSIIYNLLSNAIKFRDPDRRPEIHISAYHAGSFLMLSVKDNGMGIDSTKGDKMFLMFKRLHAHVEGTGVGLYIVKRIIENNGGKIEVESKVGEGTEFKVYFPMHR